MTIDLNCDLGELPDVPEELLMPYLSSASVACGAHAGDASTMERTVRLAQQHGVAVGAHPGYPDRANFGRVAIPMPAPDLARTVFEQIRALAEVAGRLGCPLVHLKPHGALYNVAARDAQTAQAIAEGAARWSRKLVLVGLAGSSMLDVWKTAGFAVAAEGFADRAYEPDGTLRSRALPGAVITDPLAAAQQAVALAGRVQTLCIHGDNPAAARIVPAVRRRLEQSGFEVRALAARQRPA
jgi:UPF0271 protein